MLLTIGGPTLSIVWFTEMIEVWLPFPRRFDLPNWSLERRPTVSILHTVEYAWLFGVVFVAAWPKRLMRTQSLAWPLWSVLLGMVPIGATLGQTMGREGWNHDLRVVPYQLLHGALPLHWEHWLYSTVSMLAMLSLCRCVVLMTGIHCEKLDWTDASSSKWSIRGLMTATVVVASLMAVLRACGLTAESVSMLFAKNFVAVSMLGEVAFAVIQTAILLAAAVSVVGKVPKIITLTLLPLACAAALLLGSLLMTSLFDPNQSLPSLRNIVLEGFSLTLAVMLAIAILQRVGFRIARNHDISRNP